jgi:hypothetical protein
VTYSLEPEPSGQPLDPGAVRVFDVRATPLAAGTFSLPLRIFSGNTTLADWNVRVAARAAIPKELEKRPASAKQAQPAALEQASPPPSPELHSIDKAFLLESTPHTIAIRWEVPHPPAREFFIERREIRPGPEGETEVLWVRWQTAEIEISGDSATARFRKLPAGTFWNIRIRSVDDQGLESLPPRGFFRIETRPPPPLLPPWFWWVASPAVLLLLYWLWKKLRAVRRDDLDNRIENLGSG